MNYLFKPLAFDADSLRNRSAAGDCQPHTRMSELLRMMWNRAMIAMDNSRRLRDAAVAQHGINRQIKEN
jgi:hypothetical protein